MPRWVNLINYSTLLTLGSRKKKKKLKAFNFNLYRYYRSITAVVKLSSTRSHKYLYKYFNNNITNWGGYFEGFEIKTTKLSLDTGSHEAFAIILFENWRLSAVQTRFISSRVITDRLSLVVGVRGATRKATW